MQTHLFTANQVGERLDRTLAHLLPHLSRAHLQRLIRGEHVTVNRVIVLKPSRRLAGGETIVIHIPPPEPQQLEAEHIPLEVLYQDDELAVVNKAAGMVVHPGSGHNSGTLVHALLACFPRIALVGGKRRPGIVHRLDKDTSGLIIVALTEPTRLALKAQFQEQSVRKTYLALTEGVVSPPQGLIDAPIGRNPRQRKRMAVTRNGRKAQTEYRTLEAFDAHTLVEAYPKTGRTHQIRVHFSFLGHPLASDQVYGRRQRTVPLKRHFLHAYKLTITLPGSGRECTFTAPLPNDLKHVLRLLKAEWSPEPKWPPSSSPRVRGESQASNLQPPTPNLQLLTSNLQLPTSNPYEHH